jgi:hypothetical protein
LQQMLGEGSKYIVYWAVETKFKELKKKVDLNYKENIRNYIARNTNWRVGADETIRPVLQVIFGELLFL